MSVKDFDASGKLVDVSKIKTIDPSSLPDGCETRLVDDGRGEPYYKVIATSGTASVGPGTTPPVPDPLGMKPSGSTPLRYNFIDGFRTLMTGFSIYGAAQAVLHFLTFAGLVGPAFLPRYAAEIAAFTACGCHLASAILADNTPRS